MDFDIGTAPDPHGYDPDGEEKIRREYRNLAAVEVPDVVTKKGEYRFVIPRFLEIDERGGIIGIAPLVYKSNETKDEGHVVLLASHALQTEEGVARVLAILRADYCEGNTDEAVEIVDAAKRALGIDCEEAILELRGERAPAKLLMERHAARTEESKRLATEAVAKQLSQGKPSGDAAK